MYKELAGVAIADREQQWELVWKCPLLQLASFYGFCAEEGVLNRLRVRFVERNASRPCMSYEIATWPRLFGRRLYH